jgi:hypothetical protein
VSLRRRGIQRTRAVITTIVAASRPVRVSPSTRMLYPGVLI